MYLISEYNKNNQFEIIITLIETSDIETHKIYIPEGNYTEKSLEDMTLRDWRIFREDFDIQVFYFIMLNIF